MKKLSKTIIKVLTNSELHEKLSQNALKWSSQFSWDKSAGEFMTILNKAMKEGNKSSKAFQSSISFP